MKTYQIEKPLSDTGCLVSLIKYTALFVITFLAGYIALIVLLTGRKRHRGGGILDQWIGDNLEWLALLVALAVLVFYTYRIYQQLALGTPYEFTFSDGKVRISCLNPMDGETWEMEIPESEIHAEVKVVRSLLIGSKRMVRIYQSGKLRTQIDVDLTAWKRNEELNELIQRLTKAGGHH